MDTPLVQLVSKQNYRGKSSCRHESINELIKGLAVVASYLLWHPVCRKHCKHSNTQVMAVKNRQKLQSFPSLRNINKQPKVHQQSSR